MQLKRTQAGFSLLEVMVVIVILGILATMILPNVFGSRAKADHQKVVSDLTALENAIETYYLDNGRYPTTEQGLDALIEAPHIDPRPRNYPEGGYIRRLPSDPWGNAYQLVSPGNYGRYDIFSAGQDGVVGTDDDIGTWNMDETPES